MALLSRGAGRLPLLTSRCFPYPWLTPARSPLHLAVVTADHVCVRWAQVPLLRSSPSSSAKHVFLPPHTRPHQLQVPSWEQEAASRLLPPRLPAAMVHLLWAEPCGPPCLHRPRAQMASPSPSCRQTRKAASACSCLRMGLQWELTAWAFQHPVCPLPSLQIPPSRPAHLAPPVD